MSVHVPSNDAEPTGTVAAGGRTHYDGLAMTLHWLTALLVLTQFALAELWDFAPRAPKHLMIVAHMSFGILLTVVLIGRIAWRLTPGHAVRDAATGLVELVAKIMHVLLYALLAAEVALGFLWRWSGDEALSFFGLLIPPPFAPFSKPAHNLIGDLHDWTAWTIVALAVGHAGAALFHHYVVRDDVLLRMVPNRLVSTAKQTPRRPA